MKIEEQCPRATPSPSTVIPLPLAFYESNGVIFELYRGGGVERPMMIRWERLQTFSVTHENSLTFHVRVSQRQEMPSK